MKPRRRSPPFLSPVRLSADLALVAAAGLLVIAALSWTGLFDAIDSWLVRLRLNWHTWNYHPEGPARGRSPFPDIAVLHFDQEDLVSAGADAAARGVSPEVLGRWHEREQLQWMVLRSLETLADLKERHPEWAPPVVGLDFYNLGRADATNREIVTGIARAAARLGNVVDGYLLNDPPDHDGPCRSVDFVIPEAAAHGFLDLLRPSSRWLTAEPTHRAVIGRSLDDSASDWAWGFAMAVRKALEAHHRRDAGWKPSRLSLRPDPWSTPASPFFGVTGRGVLGGTDRDPGRMIIIEPLFLPPRASVSTAEGLAPARSAFPVIHFRDLLTLDLMLRRGLDPARWPALGTLYQRALLVGVDLPDIDRVETPYSNRLHGSQRFPGVEVHANILYALLNGTALRPLHWQHPAVSWLILFLLMLGSAWSAGRLAFGWSVVAGLGVVGGLVAVDTALWHVGLIWLPLAPWLAGIALSNRLAAQVLARRERRTRELVTRRLEQHVSASVAQHLIHDPRAGELGAEPREVTVLFSDLEGFTGLTERLPAEEMLGLMNRYLEVMSREIAEEGGTLANYIGDAIFAIFGAPEPRADHARRAVDAAIRMQRALERLNRELAAEGHGPLAHRIGLSSGTVLCGNVGSSNRFIWTAMGDAVPIGARLEPLNKKYGTRILMTKATCENLGPGYNVRLVDAGVRVRGRQGLLDIYTVEVPPA